MEQSQLVQRSRRSITRLARFTDQLLRGQFSGCPVTVQQCYTLEALMDGPKPMRALASEVAIHQSTLTRIVEKLENRGLVKRTRKADNQRSVEVQITDAGQETYRYQDGLCSEMISSLLDMIPSERQVTVIESIETLANLLDPQTEAFKRLLAECCGGSCETEDEE